MYVDLLLIMGSCSFYKCKTYCHKIVYFSFIKRKVGLKP